MSMMMWWSEEGPGVRRPLLSGALFLFLKLWQEPLLLLFFVFLFPSTLDTDDVFEVGVEVLEEDPAREGGEGVDLEGREEEVQGGEVWEVGKFDDLFLDGELGFSGEGVEPRRRRGEVDPGDVDFQARRDAEGVVLDCLVLEGGDAAEAGADGGLEGLSDFGKIRRGEDLVLAVVVGGVRLGFEVQPKEVREVVGDVGGRRVSKKRVPSKVEGRHRVVKGDDSRHPALEEAREVDVLRVPAVREEDSLCRLQVRTEVSAVQADF
mmetsp:Transcript_22555/g.72574  ORF Transcript_22555/g.72574 Transcript_22555/m.72574 type:complete len:264 (-) Transcript_22555:1108-1899(-)